MAQQIKRGKDDSSINLVDLFFYLLNHWYWFALCILLACGYAYYKYSKTPFTYRADATVIIKDPSNSRSTARLDNYSNLINSFDMSNEILQLKSQQLMKEVVKTLDADVSYSVRDRLRFIELFNVTPVRMHFERNEDNFRSFSARVTPLSKTQIKLSDCVYFPENPTITLGDTLFVNNTPLVFQATTAFNDDAIGKEFTIWKSPLENAANAYRSRLSIKEDEGTILRMFILDYSPMRAAEILNTLVEKYNEDAILEKNRIAINTATFINERLIIIQEELGDVENSLARFKSAERIMSVDQTASEYLTESRGYNAEIVKVETRISLANYLRDYIQASFSTYDMIPVNTGLDDSKTDQGVAYYNELIQKREKLVEASSTESPAVKQIEAQLQTQRQNILGTIDNLLLSLNVQRNDLSGRERESLRKFTAMPAKAREMLSIERQQKIKESLYLFLLNKREENALTQAMVDNNARMIDSSFSSGAPISPNRNKMLLLAFLIGLMVPAVILLSILFLDNRVKTRKDVEEAISVPFLSEIPKRTLKRSEKDKFKNGVLYDPTSKGVFTEAMRLMSTNLDFMRPEGVDHAVVATTSFSVSAGKTFITTNLAACMADAGKKVIIVDVDLRKRTISGSFGLKHKTSGLSNYLYDETVGLDEIIRKGVMEGVDLIPAGHVPPNPTALLSRKRFDKLIDDLRQAYDYVLLDSVPVNVVADPVIIDRVVDMNLFILRSGQIDRRILPELDSIHDSGRLKNLAVVLNGSELKRSYGGYGYGYGYGFGYGYGYGEK